MADTTILSWITAEVDQALEQVRARLADASSGEGRAALARCVEHLHQVSGALRMVGLGGATRFCEALEAAFGALNDEAPAAGTAEVLDRAVQALKQFVKDVAQGQANVPLRLYPVYRELAEAQGRTDCSEKELFFPDFSPLAPTHPDARHVPSQELGPFLSAQRARLQRGLLAWLRKQPGGVEEMREALDALDRHAGQLGQPWALWWVACGVIEALGDCDDAKWLGEVRLLLNKLDFRVRDLAAGSLPGNEDLLRDALYCAARCSATSPRITEIKQLYRLDSLMPPELDPAGQNAQLDIESLEAALYDLHSRREALRHAWAGYVSGEQNGATKFRELVAAFRERASSLGNAHLVRLLDAVSKVGAGLPEPYPRQGHQLVIEMASAFLLIESVIDRFSRPDEDVEQQIGIVAEWLVDGLHGNSTGEAPAGLRPELTQRIGVLQLRAQVAREISANLQQVEQALDAFARDPAKRDTLRELDAYLNQIGGALKVIGFERAVELLRRCQRMVADCTSPSHAATVQDMDWIAEGLSSLGYFLEPCLRGRDPDEQPVERFLERFGSRTVHAPAAEQPKPEAPAPRIEPGGLLEIFLEEAVEVLETIEGTLPRCLEQPDDRDALVTVRRGFHTLKGSGRMVGLTQLGEIAWEIEKVLNRWLEDGREATAELIELVGIAGRRFSEWIAELREGRNVTPDGQPIVEMAHRLRAGEPSAAIAAAEAPPPKAAAAPIEPQAAYTDEVAIGDRQLSRGFFDVYLNEARLHVATLESQFVQWRGAGGEAPHEFMRAAHTLASSSATAGFDELADVAAALEQWMPFAAAGSAASAPVVEAAIAALRAMVSALERGELPEPDPRAANGLDELRGRLHATPETQPAPAKPKEQRRVMRDDIDDQLLPVFLEEAQELVPQIGSDLRDWKAAPLDEGISGSLRRSLHTLKGSARMAGAIRLGELTHLMETAVEAALESQRFPKELFEDLEGKMDRLSVDIERLARGEPEELPTAPEAAAGDAPDAPAPTPAAPAAMLRINADTLDHLINQSGEVSIARSRIEAELRAIKQALADLGESVERLRSQLREVEIQADSQMQSRFSVIEERNQEYDPLEFDRYTRLQELTRLMAESLHDAASIQQSLHRNLGETDAALLQQARISRDVQQALMRMRAVPFTNLSERLHRIVRQTAREVDKKAELQIEGGQVELDRSVLERIAAPLEHMLRNAVGHGLEAPAARLASGKPETGRVSITVRQESNEIALIVSDDGAGLDFEALRRQAREKGLLPAGAEPSEAELTKLIFVSGLSTAAELTELSGRGIGMDVVRNEIVSIGGRIDVASTAGEGTTFAVHLPLTLAVTQAVLVRAGGMVCAVPSAMVEQVLRVKAEEMKELYEQKALSFQDRDYPVHSLLQLFGMAPQPEIQPYNSVLLLRSGIQRLALHVDELIGNQEIVVKSIGPQLARVPGVTGATVLADGRIVLIVNPAPLAQRGTEAPLQLQAAPAPPVAQGAGQAELAPLIMVVDDSLTVRKVTSRLLEREGYRVATAKDGVDALEQMKDRLPDAMLVDIEMPRMDGFDLARNVRGDPKTSDIPIIIISSRTAEKHRAQASTLGVAAFLGKPYEEAELLQQLALQLQDRRVAA